MTMHLFAKVTPDEIDRRESQQYSLKLTALNFGASVVILSLGVVFLNLAKLSHNMVVLGAIYTSVGLLFLLAGVLLVCGIATKNVIFFNVWYGVVVILLGFHLYHLSNTIKELSENGQRDQPSITIAIFYGVNFALGMGSILVQGACVGLVTAHRGWITLQNSNGQITSLEASKLRVSTLNNESL